MSALDLAINELYRLLKNPLSTLAVLALIVVPLIYSGSYLFANQDPYGNLKNIPVAITNADKTDPDSFSQRLVDQLMDSRQFNFSVVDADTAKMGVENEKYAFGLVVPAGFSDYFSDTSLDRSANRPQLQIILSATEGYIVQEIASQTIDTLKADLIAEVDAQLVNMLLGDIAKIRADLQLAADGAKELSDGLAQIDAQMPQLQDGVNQLADGSEQLAQGLQVINNNVVLLQQGIVQLDNGAAQLSAGVNELDGIANTIKSDVDDLIGKIRSQKATLVDLINKSTLPDDQKRFLLAELDNIDGILAMTVSKVDQAVGQIDLLASGAGQVAAGLNQVDSQLLLLINGLNQVSDGANQLAAGIQTLKTGVAELSTGISEANSGAKELADKLAEGVSEIPDLSDEERVDLVDFATNPIDFNNEYLTKSSNYATGLAPFFIALCAWIGAYLLMMLMRPFSIRGLLANVRAWKIAVGGLLAPALVGALQMVTVFVGVCLIINFDPVHPVWLLLFMIFTSIVYLAIMQLLIGLFDKVGMFVGLVLMVLQLTTAGGTFPWQTMPLISQILHVILPMSYTLDGIRQLAFDGSALLLWRDMLILFGWFVTSLSLSTLAASRSKRWKANRLARPIELG
jgi:putative membrane protein